MNYKKLYESIPNPFDNDDIIKHLVNAYADGKNIYLTLTKVHVDEKKDCGKYNIHTKNEFYAKLYNIWKSNILSLTTNQIEWLISKKYVDRDYYNLIDFLRNSKSIDTYEEFQNLVNNNPLIEKYGWQEFGGNSGWVHVASIYLKARKDALENVEHRLYINSDNVYTEKICSCFVDKCMNEDIPFYFKYDEWGNRDDSLVIYSSTEHLSDYIRILSEIMVENPELQSKMHEPPILTGKINNYIGYGSEPTVLLNGEITSFNEIRAYAIEKSIKKCSNEWIYSHRNMIINYNNMKMPFYEYLSYKLTDNVYSNYNHMYEMYESRGAQNDFYKYYGLVKQDFTSGKLYELIKYDITEVMPREIVKNYNGEMTWCTTIPTRNSEKISVYSSEFEKVFSNVVKKIMRNDPEFLNNVRLNIINQCERYGIDSSKICFDSISRDKLFSISESKKKG